MRSGLAWCTAAPGATPRFAGTTSTPAGARVGATPGIEPTSEPPATNDRTPSLALASLKMQAVGIGAWHAVTELPRAWVDPTR